MASDQILQQMLPYKGGVAITPSDTVSLTTPCRGLYVGTGGNVSAVLFDNVAVTLTGLLAGSIYSLRVKRINATGTTASNLVALY